MHIKFMSKFHKIILCLSLIEKSPKMRNFFKKPESSGAVENPVKVEKPKKEKKVKEKKVKEKKEKKPKKEKPTQTEKPVRPNDVKQPAKLKKFNMHPKILNVKEFIRKDKKEDHINVMIMKKERRVKVSNFQKTFKVLTEMFYEYVDITKVNGMFYLRRFVSRGFQR